MSDDRSHPSSSHEQRETETLVLERLATDLGVRFGEAPPELRGLKLDGYAAGDPPVLVEVFAHVGRCKSGQHGKIARDMTKLLLAERLLPGRRARKIVAFVSGEARRALEVGWPARFAREFEVPTVLVDLPKAQLEELGRAQDRQRR
jgi:hypothetical protein